MRYNDEMVQRISQEAKGKIIESLERVDDETAGEYWVMTFTDGSEISIRFMVELVN